MSEEMILQIACKYAEPMIQQVVLDAVIEKAVAKYREIVALIESAGKR